jgi:hypothetical protein
MNRKPTRRSFFTHAGVALAAPLAATAALAESDDDVAARLAALEDSNAIRAVLQRYAQRVNAGTDPAPAANVRGLSLDAEVTIEVAGDGTATAQVPCTAYTAIPIEGCGTLVEMARLQGDGVIKHHERRMLAGSFVKRDGAWEIASTEFRA